MNATRYPALYEQILFEKLKIPADKAYHDPEQIKAIREKLVRAAEGIAEGMQSGLTEFVGINVCVHIASSAVLLGSDHARLTSTLSELQSRFRGIDPTTVVTAASLYYIFRSLLTLKDLTDKERKSLEYLRNRFAEMGWLVGTPRMAELGFV